MHCVGLCHTLSRHSCQLYLHVPASSSTATFTILSLSHPVLTALPSITPPAPRPLLTTLLLLYHPSSSRSHLPLYTRATNAANTVFSAFTTPSHSCNPHDTLTASSSLSALEHNSASHALNTSSPHVVRVKGLHPDRETMITT